MGEYICALCRKASKLLDPQGAYPRSTARHVDCDRCGTYLISAEAEEEILQAGYGLRERAILSGVARERSEEANPITVCSSGPAASGPRHPGVRVSEMLDTLAPRSIQDTLNRVLLNLARKSPHIGAHVNVEPANDCPLLFAQDKSGLDFTLKHMVDSGLLDVIMPFQHGGGRYAVSVKGWERVEDLRHPRSESHQAFVAMWFDPRLDEAWEKGLKPAIEGAGYAALRVDQTQFNGKICDHIVAEIRRSHFLVADVTRHRQAVYFEAGLAMGLGLPVVFTCHQDDFSHCNFDTRQYNHIVWESPGDLRENLSARIAATIAPPPRVGTRQL